MTVPAPPSLGSVPSPAPTTADPDNFDARADAFHQVFPDLVNKALPAMLAWIKAAADMIKGWAGVAQDSASTARAESGKAATSAAQAASGASTAVAGANAAGASATAAAASQTAAKGSADAAKLSADQAASSAGVASSGGIRWDRAQTLTAAQQAQALANIGATAANQAVLAAANAAAVEAARFVAVGGVRVARNLAALSFAGEFPGMFQLVTPISRTSATMFRFDIRGYDFAEARLIEYRIAGYCYPLSNGVDGAMGILQHVSVLRIGNTAKNRIFMGFDAVGGLNILFGTPGGRNYYVGLAIDGQFHHGISSVNPADYRLVTNNSAAPAAGATSGFGLTCLVEV